MTVDSPPIAKLRAELAAQVAPPLEVSTRSSQYYFSEDSAAFSEIDVRDGEAFAIVVIEGALPSEEFVVRVWHRYADEVWLVDLADEAVIVVPRTGVIRVYEIGEIVRSPRLPELQISVASVFGAVN
ncbi:MAG TPA: hypothetical protein VFQ53_06740 [Kofleriaceae bacterium]|nr:hypothetical protein [Kofleriaceae bacterium]